MIKLNSQCRIVSNTLITVAEYVSVQPKVLHCKKTKQGLFNKRDDTGLELLLSFPHLKLD